MLVVDLDDFNLLYLSDFLDLRSLSYVARSCRRLNDLLQPLLHSRLLEANLVTLLFHDPKRKRFEHLVVRSEAIARETRIRILVKQESFLDVDLLCGSTFLAAIFVFLVGLIFVLFAWLMDWPVSPSSYRWTIFGLVLLFELSVLYLYGAGRWFKSTTQPKYESWYNGQRRKLKLVRTIEAKEGVR